MTHAACMTYEPVKNLLHQQQSCTYAQAIFLISPQTTFPRGVKHGSFFIGRTRVYTPNGISLGCRHGRIQPTMLRGAKPPI